jgi:hypothetical protein
MKRYVEARIWLLLLLLLLNSKDEQVSLVTS